MMSDPAACRNCTKPLDGWQLHGYCRPCWSAFGARGTEKNLHAPIGREGWSEATRRRWSEWQERLHAEHVDSLTGGESDLPIVRVPAAEREAALARARELVALRRAEPPEPETRPARLRMPSPEQFADAILRRPVDGAPPQEKRKKEEQPMAKRLYARSARPGRRRRRSGARRNPSGAGNAGASESRAGGRRSAPSEDVRQYLAQHGWARTAVQEIVRAG